MLRLRRRYIDSQAVAELLCQQLEIVMSYFPISHDRQIGIEAEAWLASVSVPLCTRSMAQLAPGITNQIAAVWDDAPSTSVLLEQLLVSDDVSCLPFEVTSGLLRLYEYNARCRANVAPDTTWELPASRLRCLAPNAAFQGDQP
jgi:hypothetical protein